MKIGILGISGRVATRVMREALNRGHEVVGIDHVKGPNVDDAVDFHQLDMEDVDGIARRSAAVTRTSLRSSRC